MPAAVELARGAASGIERILPSAARLRSGVAGAERFRSRSNTYSELPAHVRLISPGLGGQAFRPVISGKQTGKDHRLESLSHLQQIIVARIKSKRPAGTQALFTYCSHLYIYSDLLQACMVTIE
jgi:hypothetical protein